MDEKKSNLLDALNIKGQIVLKRLSESKGEEKKALKEELDSTLKEIGKWVKVSEDSKFSKLYLDNQRLSGNLSVLLKYKKKILSESNNIENFQSLIDLLKELNWNNWVIYYQNRLLIEFPDDYPLL